MAAYEPFELDATRWFNSPPLKPEDLRGKVVLVEFFQMLCPGCVNHSLPQAKRVHRMVKGDQLVVLGVHSVFEHHAVTGPDALEVFLHEFGITFPVAVDRPSKTGVLPVTMKRWRLEAPPPPCSSTGRAASARPGSVNSTTWPSGSGWGRCWRRRGRRRSPQLRTGLRARRRAGR